MSTYKILTQNLKKIVTQNGLFNLIYKRVIDENNCNTNYYNTVVTGFLVTGQTISEITGEITYEGEMVTYNTPKAKWTDGENNNANQCNSVNIGGFNGLNS
jgi:hypothetical protein